MEDSSAVNCIFFFQPLIPGVLMVLFVWLVGKTMVRGRWRCVIVKSGALSVITTGTGMMLQWSVNSCDTRKQVGCDVLATVSAFM